MQTNPLITVKPIKKNKGFKNKFLKIGDPTAKDLEVFQTLTKICSTRAYSSQPKNIRDMVSLLLESYRRRTNGIELDPEHYVLSGHELLEYQRLHQQDVLRYLVYRYKYNKYPALKLVDSYPPCLQIEPSSICNYRCIMCYQVDNTFTEKSAGYMGYMSLDMFKMVIDQAQGNIEAITLASRGEPLLNRHIIDMLKYCDNKFLGLKINTNASILGEELIHTLLSSNLQTIVFSIDAADKVLYEKIRVGGKFDRVIRNLHRFNEIKNQQYPKSKIVTRISGVKINDQQDIKQMEEIWAQYADVVAFTNYTPWHSSYDNPTNNLKLPCSELWRRMFVWQDGTANPCDYDYKSILSKWSVLNQGISSIWTSDHYSEIRQHHLNEARSLLEPCRRCISV